MRAEDLKVGDIYITIGGPTIWRVPYKVDEILGRVIRSEILENIINIDGTIRREIGYKLLESFDELNSWGIKLISVKRKSHLPKWW